MVGFDGIPEAAVSGRMIGGGLDVLLMEESDPKKRPGGHRMHIPQFLRNRQDWK